jgi:hypothetical protein
MLYQCYDFSVEPSLFKREDFLEIVRQGLEKRKHRRIYKTILARFRTYPKGLEYKPSHWDIVSLNDLSAGGLLFRYNKKIRVGTYLNFLIPFPGSQEPISCLAKVLRLKSRELLYDVAASFTDIDDENTGRINKNAEDLYYRKLLNLPLDQDRYLNWTKFKI